MRAVRSGWLLKEPIVQIVHISCGPCLREFSARREEAAHRSRTTTSIDKHKSKNTQPTTRAHSSRLPWRAATVTRANRTSPPMAF